MAGACIRLTLSWALFLSNESLILSNSNWDCTTVNETDDLDRKNKSFKMTNILSIHNKSIVYFYTNKINKPNKSIVLVYFFSVRILHRKKFFNSSFFHNWYSLAKNFVFIVQFSIIFVQKLKHVFLQTLPHTSWHNETIDSIWI